MEDRLHIPISNTCNNNCLFCMDGVKGVGGKKAGLMNLDDNKIEKIIRNGVKKRNAIIVFSSEEPTLNKNIFYYAQLVKKLHCKKIGIISNGRFFYDIRNCIRALNSGFNDFSISIHAADQFTHDALTRTVGSFEQTLKAIKNLAFLKKKYDLRLSASSTVTKINLKKMGEIVDLLDPLGLDCLNFNVVIPQGNALKYAKQVIVRYSDILEEFMKVRENKKFKIPIVLTGVPNCLLVGIEKHLGKKESLIDISSPKNLKFRNLKSDYRKIKGLKCKKCIQIQVCEGVWKEYIKLFKWSEFNPIVS